MSARAPTRRVAISTRRGSARRVAIVGAGPGGLAAAMLLRQAGAEVTVHERLDRVGGRSGTLIGDSDAGRFRFDIGPTFFLYPRVLEDVFAACGRSLRDEVELIRLDPQYRIVFGGGGTIDAYGDLDRLAEQVARLSPEDAAALPRYMADNRRKLAAFRPMLEMPFTGLATYLKPQVLRSLALLRPRVSLDADLGAYFRDPRVRLAFSFQSKYLGMSPFRCPSLFSILAYMEYEFGVWHPRGGCGAVIAAMARVASEMGVDIRLDDPVTRIGFDGRRATSIETPCGRQDCDAVVVNADFAHAMQRLVPDALRRRWTDRRIAAKKFSCSTFMLYLGLRGRLDHVAHHTIHLSADYRRNLAEIEAGDAPGDPSFYVQNASVTDDGLAPDGCSTLYMLVPVGNRQAGGYDWATRAAEYRARALDRLRAIGIEDVERRIVFEKMLTPRGWEDDLAIHRGATFNLSHNLGQMLHLRPHNRFEDLDRVYLVGGGTHPGSGLPVIFESARITSRLLAEDLGLDARVVPEPDTLPVEAPMMEPA